MGSGLGLGLVAPPSVLGAAATVEGRLGVGCGGASPRGVFGRHAGALHASPDRGVAAAPAAPAPAAPAAAVASCSAAAKAVAGRAPLRLSGVIPAARSFGRPGQGSGYGYGYG